MAKWVTQALGPDYQTSIEVDDDLTRDVVYFVLTGNDKQIAFNCTRGEAVQAANYLKKESGYTGPDLVDLVAERIRNDNRAFEAVHEQRRIALIDTIQALAAKA